MNFLFQVFRKLGLSYYSLHLVTRGHYRSRDKDGGHTIRSAIVENTMLHANLTDLSFIEPELWAIADLHCGNSDFRLFCFCDLDLDPMTSTYELGPYSLEIHRMCKYELPVQTCLHAQTGIE